MAEFYRVPELEPSEYSLKMRWQYDKRKSRAVQGNKFFVLAHIFNDEDREAIWMAARQLACGDAGDKIYAEVLHRLIGTENAG